MKEKDICSMSLWGFGEISKTQIGRREWEAKGHIECVCGGGKREKRESPGGESINFGKCEKVKEERKEQKEGRKWGGRRRWIRRIDVAPRIHLTSPFALRPPPIPFPLPFHHLLLSVLCLRKQKEKDMNAETKGKEEKFEKVGMFEISYEYVIMWIRWRSGPSCKNPPFSKLAQGYILVSRQLCNV